MNKRIETISSYITKCDKVIDVGCDHALLGEILAKKGIYSVACDIRKNIIESAKKRIKDLNLDNYIEFIVSDGLKNINNKNIDTLVTSGMGTHTILSILKNTDMKFKKVITISNNNHDILRSKMNELGYRVKLEEIIYEKGKYYNLILFIPGCTRYNISSLVIGVNHQNESLLNEKLLLDLKKYMDIYKKSNDVNVLNKIKIIKEMLKK